jgi:hypothetical protein
MSVRIRPEDFATFSTFATGGSWDEVPEWLAPYWVKGRMVRDDMVALHADLDAKATRAEEFIARFVAWKLKK